jgi:ABC-2 type transport system permease protein
MTRLVRAELTKLRTTRTAPIMLAAMVAFAVVTVIFNVTVAGSQDNPPLDDDSLLMLIASPSRLVSGAVLLVGILSMAGEFRHQTITSAFLVTPNRGRVVAAKLAAGALTGLGFAAATTAVVLAVGLPWLSVEGAPIRFTGAVGRELVGVLAAAALSGLLGVGVAALVRNQVAAVTGALLWFLMVEGVMPAVLRAPTLPKWLPGGATAALTYPFPSDQFLPMWAGGLLLAGYALVLAAIGSRVTVRRDVT